MGSALEKGSFDHGITERGHRMCLIKNKIIDQCVMIMRGNYSRRGLFKRGFYRFITVTDVDL